MTRKILTLFIIGCFLSSTLYAQALSFEQRAISVQAASASIMKKLDALIEQLDRGTRIPPADLEDIISELQSINNEISDMTSELKNVQSVDKDNVCGMIRLISMAWLGIGVSSAMSLIGPIVNIIIKQENPDPEGGVLDTISLARQYLRLARKVLVTAMVVPIAFTNVMLANKQYRECMNADF
jgi:hypothetical protein